MIKKRIVLWLGGFAAIAVLMVIGITAFRDRRYNLVSVILALAACVPFYAVYEHKEGSIRRMVILAVMIAISVLGRVSFAPVPAFKPVTAIVILAALYMGPESGFLIGSLTALVSDMLFGQGPWTPFQMLSWGTIGFVAGLPFMQKLLKNRGCLLVYGAFAGAMYSGIMDIWTVLSMDGVFRWTRYLAAWVTALPFTLIYAVSNVIFLLICRKSIGEKLDRIQIKHQIF